jgi:hypothetical protein
MRQHLITANDGGNTRRLPCFAHVDRDDVRVKVRRTQDRRVKRAGLNRQVIDKSGAPAQKCWVLQAQN